MTFNIAINGYGRIGRCVARALYESKRFYGKLNLVAINETAPIETIYKETALEGLDILDESMAAMAKEWGLD